MAVVKEIINGNAKVTIHDDFYIGKSKEQIQEVIDNVSIRIKEYYYRKAAG